MELKGSFSIRPRTFRDNLSYFFSIELLIKDNPLEHIPGACMIYL